MSSISEVSEVSEVKKEKVPKKIPKKRGRKPKPKPLNPEPKVKKKRGRKPKPKPLNPEPKVLKKRGRKPKYKTYGYNKDKKSSFNIQDDNIIIHLPIKDIENVDEIKNLLEYNPLINEPQPFEDLNKTYTFLPAEKEKEVSSLKSYKKEPIKSLIDIEKQRDDDIDDIETFTEQKSVTKCLIQFDETKQWPKTTNISCWWCTYNFKNTPCGLPTSMDKESCNVLGIFCSPECAAAYNFDSKDSCIWERYALLNTLYGNKLNKIKLAPPREILKKFGGHITINQFRNNSKSEYNYKLIIPPLKSIVPSIEYNDLDNGYSSVLDDKIFITEKNKSKSNTRLKLKRKTPYTKNTLAACMNINST